MIKVGDTVKYNSSIGKVIEKKLIQTPSFLSNFTLYRVGFEEGNKEWINRIYLLKVKL